MARAARLLDIIEALRARRRPVSAEVLAEKLGVSVRTIYRDIATLTAQGAAIRGDPGQGYVLERGFMLPPLMFTAGEVDALVLGLRLAAGQGDDELASDAQQALAKLTDVLPEDRRRLAEESGLTVAPRIMPPPSGLPLPLARKALREERKLALHYSDGARRVSHRIVWPVALAFFEDAQVLAAWCELREDFRSFRLDRILGADLLQDRLPLRRATLLRRWRQAVGAPDHS